jgi:uncharacterized coiled-coil DUF342 family protein
MEQIIINIQDSLSPNVNSLNDYRKRINKLKVAYCEGKIGTIEFQEERDKIQKEINAIEFSIKTHEPWSKK